MTIYTELQTTYERQALQLFHGATWDGFLISKTARDNLVLDGRALRRDGMNYLSEKGSEFVIKNKLHLATSMKK